MTLANHRIDPNVKLRVFINKEVNERGSFLRRERAVPPNQVGPAARPDQPGCCSCPESGKAAESPAGRTSEELVNPAAWNEGRGMTKMGNRQRLLSDH